MSQTFEAMYDGTALHPLEPLPLPPNSKVRITLEVIEPENPKDFLTMSMAFTSDGFEDWSDDPERYLYGTRR